MNEVVRNTLYGGKSSNTCAFCALHGKSLTPRQLKKHKCLAKGCTALIKHEHPYWENREKTKQLRAERKVRMETEYARITGR